MLLVIVFHWILSVGKMLIVNKLPSLNRSFIMLLFSLDKARYTYQLLRHNDRFRLPKYLLKPLILNL